VADAITPTVLPQFREPQINQVIGSYRIVDRLGEGGMAQVFEVVHTTVGTKAALKVPRSGLDPELVDRFLAEARAHLSLVGKPNIVAPMGTEVLDDGRPYLLMQRVEGSTLDKYLESPDALQLQRKDPELALRRVIRFTYQIATALDAAHGMNPPIVHRDLKPSNVYLVKDQRVRVLRNEVELVLLGDFGLAWSRGDQLTAVGTPEYVSPEQAKGEAPTQASDLYALGVMLYEMIEERLPFPSRNDVLELLRDHRSAAVPPLKNPVATGRPELVGLVMSLLAKHPSQRPSSARQVMMQLENVMSRLEGWGEGTTPHFNLNAHTAQRPTTQLPARARVVEPPHQPKRAWLVIGVAIIAIGVAWLGASVFGPRAASVAEPTKVEAVTLAPEHQTPPVIPAPTEPTPAGPTALVPPVAQKPLEATPESGPRREDDLAPLQNPRAMAAKPHVALEPRCVPDGQWQRSMNFDLDSTREVVAKAEDKTLFIAFERAQTRVLEKVIAAKTQSQCAEAQAEVDQIVKKFNP